MVETNLKVVKNLTNIDLDEKEIQKAFESNLESIEEGLRYIGSFIPIGTGVIDTLAIDDENNPVIIEFKKKGDFDEEALIQVMNYYSWFVSDENHVLYLKNLARKSSQKIEDLGSDLRLIIVLSDVKERVKNACWALEPKIKIVEYFISKDSKGEIQIIPKVAIDTSVGGEREVKLPKTEDEHFKGKEDLKQLYDELISIIREKINIKIKPNPAPQDYIALANRKNFCGIHIKTKFLRLDLLLTPEEVETNPRLIGHTWNDEWSFVRVSSKNEIDEDLIKWIKIAYDKAS